jgi:hypothetical protein
MAAEAGDMPAVVEGAAVAAPSAVDLPVRSKQDVAVPQGQALTGKQEHCESKCAQFHKYTRCNRC